MISKDQFNTIIDILKRTKHDLYIIRDCEIIGARVTRSKDMLFNIESISITETDIHLDDDIRINMQIAKPFIEYASGVITSDYEPLFRDHFCETKINSIYNIYYSIIYKYENMKYILEKTPLKEIDRVDKDDDMMKFYNRKAKNGISLMNKDSFIVPLSKSFIPTLKADKIGLKIYHDSDFKNKRTYIYDFIVTRKSYKTHYLVRVLELYKFT